jgi:hypothetical protein
MEACIKDNEMRQEYNSMLHNYNDMKLSIKIKATFVNVTMCPPYNNNF